MTCNSEAVVAVIVGASAAATGATDLPLATVVVARAVSEATAVRASVATAAVGAVAAEAASKTQMKTKKVSFRRLERSPSLRGAAVVKATEVAARVASVAPTVATVATVVSVVMVTVATAADGDSPEADVDIAAVRTASPKESSYRPSRTKVRTRRLSSSEE